MSSDYYQNYYLFELCPYQQPSSAGFRYFEDDEVDEGGEDDNLEYQPAPDSPGAADKSGNKSDDSDESVDPLDAFMEGINVSRH